MILRRYPEDLYEMFSQNKNLFTTTIHVLVSAISKLARGSQFPEGTRVYRGLGGTLDLPDHFFRDGKQYSSLLYSCCLSSGLP